MRHEILRMERVDCVEEGVRQLEGFSLQVFAGEIMGLLPLHNHGLSALLDVLQRNSPLQGGYVYYREEQINTWHVSKPRVNRIGIIQSESCLVEGLTVADNIFVLRPGFRSPLVRPRILREQLQPFLQSVGVEISAGAYVEELSVFERVVVELLKAVVAGCKLIVLRDIGAHVSELELRKLQTVLRHYAAEGIAFLYIDFHAEDLEQICDRVALMDNGRIIKVLPSAEAGALQLCASDFDQKVRRQLAGRKPAAAGRPVFEAQGLTGECVRDLSFSLRPGECLVLQDLDNQIFGELLAILAGERAPRGGRLLLEQRDYRPSREVAVIQELPSTTMLFPKMSTLDNLCFTLDDRLPELWRSGSVRTGIQRELAAQLGAEVFQQRVDALSEMQKYELVYTRIALQHPKVVFCVQPFRRADLELRMRIWELLKGLLDKGIAVVILAVNLADALSLADRLIRVSRNAPPELYERGDFQDAAIHAPWLDLYRAGGAETMGLRDMVE